MGRQANLTPVEVRQIDTASTDNTPEQRAKALIICNTIDRPDWKQELDNAMNVLDKQLRFQVSQPFMRIKGKAFDRLALGLVTLGWLAWVGGGGASISPTQPRHQSERHQFDRHQSERHQTERH